MVEGKNVVNQCLEFAWTVPEQSGGCGGEGGGGGGGGGRSARVITGEAEAAATEQTVTFCL